MNRIKFWLKGIARKILSDEIDSKDRLISRLVSYAYPHAPELVEDGTDQSYNLQYRLDVGKGFIPEGTFDIENTIIMSGDVKLFGKQSRFD